MNTPKPKPTKRTLECNLTDAELKEKCDAMIKDMGTRDALDIDRKAVSKEFREKIAAIDSRVHATAKQITERKEHREVLCEDTPDFERKLMVTVRKDTGAVQETRALRKDEMQLKMKGADDDDDDDDKAADAPKAKPPVSNLHPITGGKAGPSGGAKPRGARAKEDAAKA